MEHCDAAGAGDVLLCVCVAPTVQAWALLSVLAFAAGEEDRQRDLEGSNPRTKEAAGRRAGWQSQERRLIEEPQLEAAAAGRRQALELVPEQVGAVQPQKDQRGWLH